MPAIEEFPDVAETSAVHEFPAIEEFPDADAAASGGAESVSPPAADPISYGNRLKSDLYSGDPVRVVHAYAQLVNQFRNTWNAIGAGAAEDLRKKQPPEEFSDPTAAQTHFDSSRLGADEAALLNLQDPLRGYNPAALNPMPTPPNGALVEPVETPLDKVWRLVRQSKALRPVFGDPGGSGDDFQQRGIPATLASIPARPFVGAGKGAQAVVGDVAELEQGNPTLENLSAASRGEALPVLDKIASAALEEHERGEFGVPSLLAHISLGMADLAPKLLAMQGGPAMAGSVFGTGPDNSFDLSAGAMGAVLPGISKGTRAVVADAVDAGVKRGATWLAQPAVEKTLQVAANQAAMDGVMALQQSPELLALAESDPREFKRRVAELVGSNLAFAVPEIMRQTPTQEVFEGEPQNPTGIEPQRRRDAEMTKFLNAPLPETRNVRFKAEENISSPKTLVDADKDQVGYLGIQEFPAESSPAEAVQSSDPGLVQTPGAVAATPAAPESSLVPESGTLQAIAEQKPVTAQRVARVEASKPYTVEQALKDLPSVVQELKAALEANRLKPPEVSSQLPVVSSQPIQPARGDARPTTAIKSAERSLEYTLLDAVKDNGGLGGPDLETAMREMAAGKTAAQVTARYGAEYDALADVLETIFEARRGKKNNNVANQLAKAYEQAGFGGNRKGVDQALLGMTEAHQQGMGVAGGLPADHGDLIGRAWEMAQTRAKGGRELPQSAEGKAELVWQTATEPQNKVGLKKIDISELKVGDTFRLKGKGLSHEEFEVTHIDRATGEVQVKDGPTFKTQDLPPGTEIYVRELSQPEKPDFAAGDDLTPRPERTEIDEAIHEKHRRLNQQINGDGPAERGSPAAARRLGPERGNNASADSLAGRPDVVHLRGAGERAFAEVAGRSRLQSGRNQLDACTHDAAFYTSPEGRRLATVARAYGVDVGFYQATKPGAPRGFFDSGRMFLNSSLPALTRLRTLEHEVVHSELARGNARLAALLDLVDLNSAAARQHRQRYEAWLGRPLTDAKAREEIVADYVSGEHRFADLRGAFADSRQAAKLATEYHRTSPGTKAASPTAERGPPKAASGEPDESRFGWYYDNILRALDSWQGKGTREQLIAHLAKFKGTKDQAEWIGLDDFLKDNPTVTRQQVADFVLSNRVEVQEVTKGEPVKPADINKLHQERTKLQDSIRRDVAETPELREMQMRLREASQHAGESYNDTLAPGYSYGSDFIAWQEQDPYWRQWLGSRLESNPEKTAEAKKYYNNWSWRDYNTKLTDEWSGVVDRKFADRHRRIAEIENQMRQVQEVAEPKFSNYQLPGGENYRELLLTLPGKTMPEGYRVQERGGKFHVINNQGTDLGAWNTREAAERSQQRHPDSPAFQSTHFDEPNILAHVRFNERTDAQGRKLLFLEEIQSDLHQKGRKVGYVGDRTLPAGWEVKLSKGNDPSYQIWNAGRVVASNPHWKTEQAALNEFFTNPFFKESRGEIGRVPNAPFKDAGWKKLALRRMLAYAAENGFDGIGWTTGEQQAARYDLSKQVDSISWTPWPAAGKDKGLLTAHKGETRVIKETISRDELPNYIGKDAAEKLLAAEPEQLTNQRSISGDDLKVGGRGMLGFYDKELPNLANDIAKKFGQRVERTEIITGKGGKKIPDGAGGLVETGAGRETVHFLATPENMRRQIQAEGLPQFSPGEAEPWQELKQKRDAAEEKLRSANKLVVHPEQRRAAGLSKQQAANQRDVATAEFRRAQDALRENPEYIEAIMRRQNEIQFKIRNEKLEKGQERADLEGEFETLQAELEAAPKKIVAYIHAQKFMTGEEKTPREERAGSEAAGTPNIQHPPSNAEIAAETQAARRKKVLKELPERTREVFQTAGKTKDKLTNLWTARENRDVIAYTFDAAENGGNLFGKQAANEVLHALNRSFGATGERVTARNPVREQALTFVIESGLNEGELNAFETTIRGSAFADTRAGKDALAAIKFAQTHWERLAPVAELYSKITDAQVEHENLAGVETLHRKGGYVLHMNDLAASQPILDIGANSGFGPASPFLKVRQYATYADAVANGIKPKSINAVDLLQKRLSLGQKKINHGAWVDGMRRMIDPASQLPLVTELQTHVRADGKEYEDAPPGYTVANYAGQKFAILKGGYDTLLKSLTTPSTIRDSVIGNIGMELAGGIKHGMLVFDSYHLGRLAFWNSMVRGMGLPGNPAAYKRGLTLLDQTMPEIRRMVEGGEIPAKLGADLIESKRQLNLLVSKGLNVGGAADNIATHFVQHLPIAGRFNRFLFQEFQRGATAEASLIELRRQQKMFPNVPEEVLARRVAADLNTRFGNLQNQSWIKNKNVADGLRMLFLAPQWNESLIRSEIGAVKELGQAIPDSVRNRQLAIGLLGRSVFTAALGTFLANQVINYITRGKPTWDNEEESEVAKISAWIPDVVGNGPGYFLNPLTLPAEMSELLMKKTERSGDMTKALKEALAGRLGPLGRIPYTLAAREDSLGAKLKTGGEVMGQMVSNLVPAPISGGTIVRAGKQLVTGQPEEKYPGQFQRQAAQTFGIKLDSAPTADQRIGSLAKEFNRKKGITPGAEYFHGDYYELDNALRIGNERDAKAALEELLQKKTPKDIRKHYETWARARFTGKTDREAEFKRTLNPEQLQTYEKARQRREEIRQRVNGLLR